MKRHFISSVSPRLGLALAIAAGFLAPITHAADKAEVNTRFQTYYKAGKAVVDMAISKKVDAAEVEKKVEVMLAEATWLAKEYGKAHPKGEKLLAAVVSNVDAMKKLSFKDLEHDWHDLHHFDKGTQDIGINPKAEENEHFTDPIHSIVHPLLVLKAAQAYATSKSDDDLKSIKEEMEEGLEQIEKVKDALSK
jgi:hypothetical protein